MKFQSGQFIHILTNRKERNVRMLMKLITIGTDDAEKKLFNKYANMIALKA